MYSDGGYLFSGDPVDDMDVWPDGWIPLGATDEGVDWRIELDENTGNVIETTTVVRHFIIPGEGP